MRLERTRHHLLALDGIQTLRTTLAPSTSTPPARAPQDVAPEVEGGNVVADQPVRDQVDLDSLDWLNFLVSRHSAVEIDIPEADYGKLVILTDVTDYVAARVTP
ncbi:hypothetical protein [Rhodococcus sp. JS3073]|uniref:hypothetical protein n=1 Tax=Rhodococcus sp. JS3073 TaxID=3002901 RepID=UPI002E1DE80A